MLQLAGKMGPWFSAVSLEEMAEDFPLEPGYVAERGGGIVGFITWDLVEGDDSGARIELTWLGVDPTRHRQGIGKALLAAMESTLRATSGVRSIELWTVAASSNYTPYVPTRAFYHAQGYQDWYIDSRQRTGAGAERLFLRKLLA